MPKKYFAKGVFTALFAIMTMLASTGTMAQETDCSPHTSFSKDGYTVTFLGSERDEDSPTFYRYIYKVNKKVSFPVVAIPECCPDEDKIVIRIDNENNIFDLGEGEPATGFLSGYYQAFAIRLTPQPDQLTYDFLAKTPTIGETTVCIKKGSSFVCGAIAGPVCPAKVRSTSLCEEFGPDKFCFVRTDPTLLCYDEVYACDKGVPAADCIQPGNKIDGEQIDETIEYDGPKVTERTKVTIVRSEQRCITYFQFGEASTRCPSIGGKVYCR